MLSSADVLSALNTVGLTPAGGGAFRPICPVPDAIQSRFPVFAGEAFDVAAAFPFLELFLVDASVAWDANAPPLRSGSWTQEDALGDLTELEAIALRSDGRRILLVGFVSAFRETHGILQSAREKMLEFESLEKLHARLTDTSTELQTVAEQRKEALGLLEQVRGELEQKVEQRTAELVIANEQLRSLANQLAKAEESERRRIAAYLHDRIGQTLALTRIQLGMLGADLASTGAEGPGTRAGDIRRLVDEAIADTRGLTFDLGSPVLYELGLGAALESLASQFEATHGIGCSFVADERIPSMDHDVQGVLFRGVRELLHNAIKHADATQVQIALCSEADRIEVTVEDDGVGFDAETQKFQVTSTGGFGLFNLRERLSFFGGLCTIVSMPAKGTRVTLALPADTTRRRLK